MNAARIILVDQREKKPLPFPEYLTYSPDPGVVTTYPLRIVKTTLHVGDYTNGDDPLNLSISSSRTAAVIERKHTLDELADNLLTDVGRRRFLRELACFEPFRHRLLLLEGPPSALYNCSRSPKGTTPESRTVETTCELQRLALRHRVHLHFLPSAVPAARVHAAEWAARFLITADSEP